MKHLFIILLLIVLSCKSETKTENGIDQTVQQMWENYIKFHPEFKNNNIPESWYFHNNKEDANRLAKLTMTGKKRAASGLYAWYVDANADLPKIGTKHIITDFEGKAQAIIEIKKVDTIPFNQISKAYAELDMGTQIEPLKTWKKAHWDFFASTMEESDENPTEDMLIVCEWFDIIWTEEHKKT